jgi:hypothetical protein
MVRLSRIMRALTPLLTAVSLVFFLLVIALWVRSYFRYDGLLHYAEGSSLTANASKNGKTQDMDVSGHSSGLISYRGRMTYLTIANPLKAEPWESWTVAVDSPPAGGPMLLAWEARSHSGVAWGSARTVNELQDPVLHIGWRLPYSFVTLPYWVPAILLGILPYRWLMRRRQSAAWRAAGRCEACGEKLKGATTCPACGAAVAAEPAAAG